MAVVFLIVGFIMLAIGGLWMLIEAFKTSILWGLAYMFIPFASLVWIILHFDQAARPLFLSLGGGGVLFLGVLFGS